MKKKRHYQENNHSPSPPPTVRYLEAIVDGKPVWTSKRPKNKNPPSPPSLPIRPKYLAAVTNGKDGSNERFRKSEQLSSNDESSDQEVSFKHDSTIDPPPKKRIGKSLSEDAKKHQDFVPEASLPTTSENNSVQGVRHSKRLDPFSKFAIDTSGISAAAQVTFETDLFELMKVREHEYLPHQAYLTWQPLLSPKSRCKALEWLAQIAQCEGMARETYYKAVNYVDRYLSLVPKWPIRQVQLLCLSALSVAAKVEEHDTHLNFSEIAAITEHEFTVEQASKMEQVLVETIKWNLLPPTVISWFNLYIKRIAKRAYGVSSLSCERELFVKVMRLLDLCTLDYFSLQYPPSLQAFCALSLLYDQPEHLVDLRPKEDPLQQECMSWMRSLYRNADVQRILEMKALRQNLADCHLLQETYPDAYNLMSHKMRIAREQRRAKAAEKPTIDPLKAKLASK